MILKRTRQTKSSKTVAGNSENFTSPPHTHTHVKLIAYPGVRTFREHVVRSASATTVKTTSTIATIRNHNKFVTTTKTTTIITIRPAQASHLVRDARRENIITISLFIAQTYESSRTLGVRPFASCVLNVSYIWDVCSPVTATTFCTGTGHENPSVAHDLRVRNAWNFSSTACDDDAIRSDGIGHRFTLTPRPVTSGVSRRRVYESSRARADDVRTRPRRRESNYNRTFTTADADRSDRARVAFGRLRRRP